MRTGPGTVTASRRRASPVRRPSSTSRGSASMFAPPTPRGRVARLAALATAAVLLTVGFGRLAPGPERAAAAVGHRSGYRATVDGFTSWYGSYDMGAIGPAWCIDHGIRAPDPALAYVATDLGGTPADVQVALAWALGRHGVDPDRAHRCRAHARRPRSDGCHLPLRRSRPRSARRPAPGRLRGRRGGGALTGAGDQGRRLRPPRPPPAVGDRGRPRTTRRRGSPARWRPG